jgi:hypothetical protein
MVISPAQKGLLFGPETRVTQIALPFLVVEEQMLGKHTGCQVETIVLSSFAV